MKRLRNVLCLLVATLMTASLAGCASGSPYRKYSATFLNAFDTVIEVMGYTKTEREFKDWAARAEQRFLELDHLYDIYNDYEGLNNAKGINDNAGIAPVEVADELLDLIEFAALWYDRSPGQSNIALGAPLRIWRRYREAGIADPEGAALPPMDQLQAAAEHTNIRDIVVDRTAGTVFLKDPEMSLDLGTVAKGYAVEVVARELKAAGWDSFILSAGGNVRVVGKPLDGKRERWGIGITNPDNPEGQGEDGLLDTVFCTDLSVVTAGDYQRYYVVDGKRYHHIIDPATLLPADRYRSVTVVTEDSGLADFIDTILLCLPLDAGKDYLETLEGVEALWVLPDGTIEVTDGLKGMLKSNGATSTAQ